MPHNYASTPAYFTYLRRLSNALQAADLQFTIYTGKVGHHKPLKSPLFARISIQVISQWLRWRHAVHFIADGMRSLSASTSYLPGVILLRGGCIR